MKSPTEFKKACTLSRKGNQATSVKNLPKLTKPPKKAAYNNDFMELVMKTYCKKLSINSDYFPDEFGMQNSLSSEEFSHFLSTVYPLRDGTMKGRSTIRPIREDHSTDSLPKDDTNLRKLEFQFVKNILLNRQKLYEAIPKSKPMQGRQKMINLLIASPKSRSLKSKLEV